MQVATWLTLSKHDYWITSRTGRSSEKANMLLLYLHSPLKHAAYKKFFMHLFGFSSISSALNSLTDKHTDRNSDSSQT